VPTIKTNLRSIKGLVAGIDTRIETLNQYRSGAGLAPLPPPKIPDYVTAGLFGNGGFIKPLQKYKSGLDKLIAAYGTRFSTPPGLPGQLGTALSSEPAAPATFGPAATPGPAPAPDSPPKSVPPWIAIGIPAALIAILLWRKA
jgi:hypothetical protein